MKKLIIMLVALAGVLVLNAYYCSRAYAECVANPTSEADFESCCVGKVISGDM